MDVDESARSPVAIVPEQASPKPVISSESGDVSMETIQDSKETACISDNNKAAAVDTSELSNQEEAPEEPNPEHPSEKSPPIPLESKEESTLSLEHSQEPKQPETLELPPETADDGDSEEMKVSEEPIQKGDSQHGTADEGTEEEKKESLDISETVTKSSEDEPLEQSQQQDSGKPLKEYEDSDKLPTVPTAEQPRIGLQFIVVLKLGFLISTLILTNFGKILVRC